MKRTKLLRKSPWKPRAVKPMKRTKLNPVNRARKAAAFVRNFHSDEYVKFTRARPCVFCSGGPCVTAHIKARGMGGCNSDWKQTLPVCCPCDSVWENAGRATLMALWGRTPDDLQDAMRSHQAAFLEQQDTEECA